MDEHTQKIKTRIETRKAIATGKLKPQPCENCGTKENVQAHHTNYAKPLEITWLCATCHNLMHQLSKSIVIDPYKCVKCGHTWTPRTNRKPQECPHCKNRKWEGKPNQTQRSETK